MTERRAWWWSTLLFGLMHLPNWFFGLGPSAIARGHCVHRRLHVLSHEAGHWRVGGRHGGARDLGLPATFVGKGAAGLALMAVGINVLALVLAIFVARRPARLAPAAA